MAETVTTKTKTSLAGKVQQPTAPAAEETNLKSSQEYLDEYEALANDPQFQREAAPETQKTLRESIDKARALYDERATRNDWLEVAQNLGRAVAQYGAARQGIAGGNRADMSNLAIPQGVDFGARSNRALSEMVQMNKNAGDLADAERNTYLDTEKGKQRDFTNQEGYLKTAVKAASDRESDAERLARAEGMEVTRTVREDNRTKEEERKRNDELRKLQLRDLEQTEKSLAGRLVAAQELFNTQGLEDDLSSKSGDKLREKYGSTAAKAGIDLNELKDKLEKEGTDPGKLWGTNPNPVKQEAIKKQAVAEIKNMLDAIRARKAQILAGKNPDETESPATPPEKKTIRIQAPDGAIAEVPIEKKEFYLKKGGKVVE